eukprot:scaffold15721_cov112-Isochrysis_galbana.AAC.4
MAWMWRAAQSEYCRWRDAFVRRMAVCTRTMPVIALAKLRLQAAARQPDCSTVAACACAAKARRTKRPRAAACTHRAAHSRCEWVAAARRRALDCRRMHAESAAASLLTAVARRAAACTDTAAAIDTARRARLQSERQCAWIRAAAHWRRATPHRAKTPRAAACRVRAARCRRNFRYAARRRTAACIQRHAVSWARSLRTALARRAEAWTATTAAIETASRPLQHLERQPHCTRVAIAAHAATIRRTAAPRTVD